MKTAGWILLPMLLLGSGSANALDVYCLAKGGSLPTGVDITHDWYITNDKVRTPQLRGQKKPTLGCWIDFNSLGGMYRPIEILVKPKSGEFKSTHNTLFYRSTKSGEDMVSVRFHRLSRTGQPESSILHLRIHVVDKPL